MFSHNSDRIILQKLLNHEIVENHAEANPLATALNLHISALDLQQIELKFDVPQQFTQGHGMVQGGIISAMLDFSAAFLGLINVSEQHSVVTTSSTVTYLRPAPLGQYTVRANLNKSGQKMIFVSAELYQNDHKLVANALFSMAVISLH